MGRIWSWRVGSDHELPHQTGKRVPRRFCHNPMDNAHVGETLGWRYDASFAAGARCTVGSEDLPKSVNLNKLRSLDPRLRARPRSVGVFCGEESSIVPQLFCPVSSLIVKADYCERRRIGW
jgi:hypothetical protein